MTPNDRQKSPTSENRYFAVSMLILGIVALLSLRLWYVQIFKREYYQEISDANRFRKQDISAPRGSFYDRDGLLLLGNRPHYDLVLIPQYTKNSPEVLEKISFLLNLSFTSLQKRMQMFRGEPKFLPVILRRNLSKHQAAIVQSNRIHLPGIEVREEPRRSYHRELPPHLFGYMAEVDPQGLKRLRSESPDLDYRPGDLVGKQGLERKFEKYLRGHRGNKYIQVDAFGRKINSEYFKESEWQETPAHPGSNVTTTLSAELQATTLRAFKGKNGSVVVLDPRNGDVLAIASEPAYNPESYQDGFSRDEWNELTSNPFHPLLDKSTGGLYSPGSLFKAVVGIAGLEEGVVNPERTFYCPGHMSIGNKTIHCHERSGHGHVNLYDAIMGSCDVYFYHVGIELGVDRIAQYAAELGAGMRLDFGVNMELDGIVPNSGWKRKTLGIPWTAGDTPNFAIGQGFLSMTPLQMAAMYSTIAMDGKLFRPRILKKVVDYLGEPILEAEPELMHQSTKIKAQTFQIMKEALRRVVMHPNGTGKKSRVEGVEVAGKTGTVQVTSLNKNKTDLDVSMKWREHAMFAAFAPVEAPEVLVLIVSEHDPEGGGGRAAAPIAAVILEKYWELKKRLAANPGQSPKL
jgi:penicillin-binding protein 2